MDFKRDGFERMMGDVKAGKIDCIIVKDLSRFGRNYIETGEYLEKLFPFLGIRFIAVNDGIDTIEQGAFDHLTLHLKNLVNDVYSRDISAKICPVLRGKQERGEFIGTWAAYGYRKSVEDKHRLVIDEKTAPVVKDIFAWGAEGVSYQNIVRKLMARGIPSPSQYRYEQGIMKNERFANMSWQIEAIKLITANEVYLGHTVQGRKQESLFQGQKQRKLPKEEWCVVKNTHKAIIDQLTFEQVQKINTARKQEHQSKQGCFCGLVNTENILKGLVYCGSCGRKLSRYKSVRENKRKSPGFHAGYRYICPSHAADPIHCTFRGIREKELLGAVLETIRVQVQLVEDLERQMYKSGGKKRVEQEEGQLEWQIRQAEAELGKVRRHKESLYDAYADHLMGEQDYIYAQARYNEKENELQDQISELICSYQSLQIEKPENNPWIKNMLQFRDNVELRLTREMAVTLIEKITVYHDTALHIDFRFQDDGQRLREFLGKGGSGE